MFLQYWLFFFCPTSKFYIFKTIFTFRCGFILSSCLEQTCVVCKGFMGSGSDQQFIVYLFFFFVNLKIVQLKGLEKNNLKKDLNLLLLYIIFLNAIVASLLSIKVEKNWLKKLWTCSQVCESSSINWATGIWRFLGGARAQTSRILFYFCEEEKSQFPVCFTELTPWLVKLDLISTRNWLRMFSCDPCWSLGRMQVLRLNFANLSQI